MGHICFWGTPMGQVRVQCFNSCLRSARSSGKANFHTQNNKSVRQGPREWVQGPTRARQEGLGFLARFLEEVGHGVA